MNRSKLFIYVGMLLVAALAVACAETASGGDDAPVPTREITTPTPQSTGTAVRPTPSATATTVQPTETPQDDLRNPDLSKVAARSLPAELDPDRATEQLSEEGAVGLWAKFFTDSYLDPTGFGDFYHFCRNGVIVSANADSASNLQTEVPRAWQAGVPSVAGSANWWEARFMVRAVEVGERFTTLLALDVLGGEASGTLQSVEKPIKVYESEYCKQVVNEPARDIPAPLLSDTPSSPAVQLTLWLEYLRGGILRSFDGRHSLEMCSGSEDTFAGRATGNLVIGNTWAGFGQLEQPETGWEHTGLIFRYRDQENEQETGMREVVAYYLQLVDGIPSLVHNPDATFWLTESEGGEWLVPELQVLTFEVVDSAVCAS